MKEPITYLEFVRDTFGNIIDQKRVWPRPADPLPDPSTRRATATKPLPPPSSSESKK